MLIGKDYKIEANPLNIILSKKSMSKKTGKETWQIKGYFATIKNALDFLVDLGVRESGLRDLRTISQKQDELHKLIAHLSAKGGIENA